MPHKGTRQPAQSHHHIIKEIWYPEEHGPGLCRLAALLLAPAAFLYRSVVGLRNRLYDRRILTIHRLPCPVISVGNITVGGTGKTPTVIMIAGMLASHGLTPAILSRGYGGASASPVNIVSDGRTILMRPEDAGDEPVLIARRLPSVPVLTGPERHLTGRTAIERFSADVLILDDAFQHRKIHRDIDILLVNRRNPFGNGYILPAGPLREPVAGVGRADVIIATGMREGESVRGGHDVLPVLKAVLQERIPVFEGRHKPQDLIHGGSGDAVSVDSIRGRRIFAFAGIASPAAFQATIEASGGNIVSFLAFDDHHRYTEKDICDMGSALEREGADLVITTEKDGVKLAAYPNFMQRLFMLRISMDMSEGQDDFRTLILSEIESWKRQRQRR